MSEKHCAAGYGCASTGDLVYHARECLMVQKDDALERIATLEAQLAEACSHIEVMDRDGDPVYMGRVRKSAREFVGRVKA